MVQSILSDDEEELSFSSYATARTDQLTGTAGTSVSTRTMVLSETSDTLVGGEEMFHTLQDVEDLAPDCLATASIPSRPPLHPPHLHPSSSLAGAVSQGTHGSRAGAQGRCAGHVCSVHAHVEATTRAGVRACGGGARSAGG